MTTTKVEQEFTGMLTVQHRLTGASHHIMDRDRRYTVLLSDHLDPTEAGPKHYRHAKVTITIEYDSANEVRSGHAHDH